MADIANLGLSVDTSQVKNAKEDLKGFKAAASDAAAGAKDMGGASQQMARDMAALIEQQKQTNALLTDHGNQLSNLKVQTTSYTDTLAKWATGVAVLYGAYVTLNGVIQYNTTIAKALGAGAVEVGSALQQLDRYGGNAFKTMTDGAVAAQKAIAAIGATVGATGPQVATFVQTLGPLGASPGAANSAFQAIQHNLSTNGQDAQVARQTLSAYGVSAEGSPEEVLQKFLTALQNVQNGPQKTQAAVNVLGPEGANLATDTITKLGELTDLQKRLNSLNSDNAILEQRAAEQRRQTDVERANWYASTPLASAFSEIQQSTLGANLTRSLQEALGRGQGGGVLGGLGDAARSVGSYLTGGQPASGNNAWYQVTQPSFISSTALNTQPAAPATPQDLAKGMSDLAAAGEPLAQQMKALSDLQGQLSDDYKKGAISTDQYRSGIARLGEAMSLAIDPITKTMIALGKQTSLNDLPVGEARNSEQFIRGQREQYYTAHPDQAKDANGNAQMPSFYSQTKMPDEDRLIAAFSQANVVGPAHDAALLARRQASGASSIADAASEGPYAEETARLKAEAGNDVARDPAAKAEIYARLAAQIDALDSSYTKAANGFIFSVTQSSQALNTEASAVLRAGSGPVGPDGILASAKASVRKRLPNFYNDDNTALDLSSQNVQADVLGASANPVQGGESMIKHLNALIQTQKSQLSSPDGGNGTGAASVGSMRGQMGITQLTTELESYKAVLTDAAKSGGDLSDEENARVGVITKEIAALKDLSQQLSDVSKARAKDHLDKSYAKQIETYQGQTAVYQRGGSPDDVQRGLDAVKIQEQYKQSGNPITPDQANALAKALQEAASDTADAKKALEDWNTAMKGSVAAITDNITNFLDGSERFKTAISSMWKTLDQIGIKTFVTDPLKTAGDSLLEKGTLDFGKSGDGVMSWMKNTFGIGPGASGGSGNGLSGNPIADALISQPINAATVILNAQAVVSGITGAAGGSGGFDNASLGGLFGGTSGAATAGSAATGSGGFDSSSLDGMFSDGAATFHDGGVVGSGGYSYPAPLGPDTFRGAPRFHSGGLLPDEVPIIAQKGERVLTKEQSAAYSQRSGGTTVHMTVNATDADSFRRSQGQIARDMTNHVNRSNQRLS